MADIVDEDLYRRTEALLEPGEIELNGVILHTALAGDEEPALHQLTLDAGDLVAEHHPDIDPAETYVYSGNDDPDFGVNQHQGLALEGDEFVWECQQLLREGHYAVVLYYEAVVDQAALVDAMMTLDGVDSVVGVEG
jgi:hypothetical protein